VGKLLLSSSFVNFSVPCFCVEEKTGLLESSVVVAIIVVVVVVVFAVVVGCGGADDDIVSVVVIVKFLMGVNDIKSV
jgi:hypothetical protein